MSIILLHLEKNFLDSFLLAGAKAAGAALGLGSCLTPFPPPTLRVRELPTCEGVGNHSAPALTTDPYVFQASPELRAIVKGASL